MNTPMLEQRAAAKLERKPAERSGMHQARELDAPGWRYAFTPTFIPRCTSLRTGKRSKA